MLIHQIERLLDKEAKKLSTLQFAMHLPAANVDYHYSSTGNQHQRFHSASVGKLLTSTLVFIAIEKGWLTLDTRVQTILKPGLLNHLFVVAGQDFQDEVWLQRRMELWGEGFSLFDILRLKKPVVRKNTNYDPSVQYNSAAEAQILIYRIPQCEMETNSGISDTDNNPAAPQPQL